MVIKYIAGGIFIVVGYFTGAVYSARLKSKCQSISMLCSALACLKTRICAYSNGLGSSLKYTLELYPCTELKCIYNQISSGIPPSDAVKATELDTQAAMALASLLECIAQGDSNEIELAFSSATQDLSLLHSSLKQKLVKEAPLYKKLGLLVGVCIFIILL